MPSKPKAPLKAHRAPQCCAIAHDVITRIVVERDEAIQRSTWLQKELDTAVAKLDVMRMELAESDSLFEKHDHELNTALEDALKQRDAVRAQFDDAHASRETISKLRDGLAIEVDELRESRDAWRRDYEAERDEAARVRVDRDRATRALKDRDDLKALLETTAQELAWSNGCNRTLAQSNAEAYTKIEALMKERVRSEPRRWRAPLSGMPGACLNCARHINEHYTNAGGVATCDPTPGANKPREFKASLIDFKRCQLCKAPGVDHFRGRLGEQFCDRQPDLGR